MVRILVVEDEDAIRDEVTDWLGFEGYDVCSAPNGRLALEAIRHELPDLIVSDIAMPEMNGYDLLLTVRLESSLAQTPFIFLTAAVDRDALRKGMTLGADDYITKPFTNLELLNSVRTQLMKRGTQHAQQQAEITLLNSALSEERERRLLKARLIAMISHDFRNPLAAIISSSDLIKNYEDRMTPARRHQYLDRINGSVHLLLQMLDDLMMVAAMESGHLDFTLETVEMFHFVEGIVDEFRLIDQGGHEIVFEELESITIDGDSKLLRQLIVNLIANALKYSPTDTAIKVGLTEQPAYIELTVEDQGIGIPPEDLPYLFEPFHRSDNAKGFKGMGLGLTIVKQAVDLHAGTVSVESEVGYGTRFTVLLPKQRDTPLHIGF